MVFITACVLPDSHLYPVSWKMLMDETYTFWPFSVFLTKGNRTWSTAVPLGLHFLVSIVLPYIYFEKKYYYSKKDFF